VAVQEVTCTNSGSQPADDYTFSMVIGKLIIT